MSDDDIRLQDIDHIGAPVWDADAATAFYQRFGKEVVIDEDLPEYNIRAVFLDFDGVYLEFLEPAGPGNVKTFLERHGPGYQHIAYRVDDIEAAVEYLRKDGVVFQSDEPMPGAGDTRIIFVEERHTAGFQVELVERI
ncbi:VOC family protein [Natronomonas salina]|uniref:VOC family protein n=1 Tax=Natronomonas salina TaxID=1710540 RepID=UPI0015B410F1|nr:VOC family protein [Natronomonas salina]QLD89146.1 VOC family protein [Natronomonas salina]